MVIYNMSGRARGREWRSFTGRGAAHRGAWGRRARGGLARDEALQQQPWACASKTEAWRFDRATHPGDHQGYEKLYTACLNRARPPPPLPRRP
jgi:hypothetical protein